jgi:hypothetical protein
MIKPSHRRGRDSRLLLRYYTDLRLSLRSPQSQTSPKRIGGSYTTTIIITSSGLIQRPKMPTQSILK